MRSLQICLPAEEREKTFFWPFSFPQQMPSCEHLPSKTNESSSDIRPPLSKTNVIPFVRKCISQVLVN